MTIEQEISQDLDLGGYHFKWKSAQELARQNPDKYGSDGSFEFWISVRQLFLELGGCYVTKESA